MPAVLVMVGDGPRRTALQRRAAGLPVTFTGFLPDRRALAAVLASADVVLAPGPVETFGLAGLEALACGTPVVVNAASALPEVVGPGGIAADGTPATFAAAVDQLLSRRFGWPAASPSARTAPTPTADSGAGTEGGRHPGRVRSVDHIGCRDGAT